MKEQIEIEDLADFAKTANTEKLKLATRAVTTNGIMKASERNDLSRDLPEVFSLEIETSGVTDQRNSGRCWLFATLNQIRHGIEKSRKIERVELSETYNYFYDKLEKANQFCELAIKFAGEPIDGRDNVYLFDKPHFEGGTWSNAMNLVKKYGVVPVEMMPESENTRDSGTLDGVLNRRLRRGGIQLRNAFAKNVSVARLRETKTEILRDIYKILVVSLGEPPAKFSWQYRDKDKKFHREANLTPKMFREKFVPDEMLDSAEIINNPPSKFGELYMWRNYGNMIDQPIYFANVEAGKMEELILKQLKAGETVPFYAMAARDMPKSGYMSSEAYDLPNLFEVDFASGKADRIAAREDIANHAMLIVGADVVGGVAKSYKVENSWGEDAGKKGFYAMSAEWFRKNGWCVVIRRNLLPTDIAKIFEQKPVTLEPWQTF